MKLNFSVVLLKKKKPLKITKPKEITVKCCLVRVGEYKSVKYSYSWQHFTFVKL